MLRRIGVLTSLAVTAAMFAGVTSAQAAPADEWAACVFDGLSGQLNPPIQAGIGSLQQTGSYSFNGDANCAAQDQDGDVLQPSADGSNVTISSEGTYDNMVCGTGWAYDTGGDSTTTVTPDDPSFPTIQGVGYEITFVGGTGPMRIGAGPATAPSAGGAELAGNYVGGGVVNIVPENIGPAGVGCVNAQVDQFVVNGGFAGVSEN